MKGFISDLMLIGVLLFFFAITIVTSFMFFSGWHNKMVETGFDNPAETSVFNSFSIFDSLFALFFLGLIIALFGSVFMLNTHPIFFIGVFLVWILVIIFGVVFANVYETYATNVSISSYAQTFPMTMFIMKNLPKELSVIGGLTIILMFGKRRMSNSGF